MYMYVHTYIHTYMYMYIIIIHVYDTSTNKILFYNVHEDKVYSMNKTLHRFATTHLVFSHEGRIMKRRHLLALGREVIDGVDVQIFVGCRQLFDGVDVKRFHGFVEIGS